jgi:hypothetical protein
MMGDDTPDQSSVWVAPAEVQHIFYREITRRMLAARGLDIPQVCNCAPGDCADGSCPPRENDGFRDNGK